MHLLIQQKHYKPQHAAQDHLQHELGKVCRTSAQSLNCGPDIQP